jgi:hypothetical protein
MYPKECKSIYMRDNSLLMFIVVLFTVAHLWNQFRCPITDEWLRKMWHICTMEYYSVIKENEIMQENL